MSSANPKILLVGPVYDTAAGNIGGATRSFGYLVETLQNSGVEHTVINTQQKRGGFAKLLYVKLQLLKLLARHDVVFLNTSQNGIRTLGPLVYVLGRFFGKPVVIRPFGRSLQTQYSGAGSMLKSVLGRTVLQSDLLYLQTHAMVAEFAPMSRNARQLSTTRKRPKPALVKENRTFNKRFVFIGQLKPEKGIDRLLEAFLASPSEVVVDFYGPKPSATFLQKAGPAYKGELSTEAEVLETMTNYDALVLPTYYEGEGYPGAIIEAYSLGMPVITTNWLSIPEIVEDGKTGLLIEPQSAEAILKAFDRMAQANYTDMCMRALELFNAKFDAELVTAQILDDLKQLLNES